MRTDALVAGPWFRKKYWGTVRSRRQKGAGGSVSRLESEREKKLLLLLMANGLANRKTRAQVMFLPWEMHAKGQASVIVFPPDTPKEPVHTRPSGTHAGTEGEI